MEKKHENYHVRPFPQQPKRGGKELIATLDQLEKAFGEKLPDLERLGLIQGKMHEALKETNDDKLVDMARQLSNWLDEYKHKPTRALAQRIIQQSLKVRIQLKHL